MHKLHNILKNVFIIQSLMIMTMWSTSIYAQNQSFSLGNTFIHGEGNMTVFDQHQFSTDGQGTQPGIIGGEREPSRGYFNFGTNGRWTNAANGHFVDGYARYFGNNPFLFPVGDNDKFRPAATASGTFVEMAYFGVNPSSAITSDIRGGNFPILPATGPFNHLFHETQVTKVSEYEYWDINGTDATYITLTWDAESYVDIITSNALNNLIIVGWDSNAGEWVKIPSAIDVNAINLNNSDAQFTGPLSTITSGSITTTIPIAPSDYEVYTLGSGCNDITVDVSNDTTICIGETVILTAESYEGSLYTWDNGMFGSQIIVTPGETTEYVVTAILGDCTATGMVTVEISEPAVDLGPDVYLCRGDEITLTAASTVGMQYEWSTGTFGGNEITISPTSSLIVSVTVTNQFNCTATDEIFVEVRDQPDVFTGRERSVCLGDSVFLQAFGSPTGYGYLWSTGDTSDLIIVSPTVDTDYEVYLSQNGCTDTSYVTVFVLEPASVEISGDSIICPGETITLTANGIGQEYEWSNGETTQSITISPTSSETYSVTMTSDELCIAVDELYVAVYDESLVDINDNVSICPGEEVTFTLNGIYDSALWPDGSTGSTYTVSPTQSSTYTVTTFFENCSADHLLTVNVVEDLAFDFGPDISICAGDSVTFNLDSLSGNFIWSTGETTPSITVDPLVQTNYSVTVTSGTCVVSDDITVNIGAAGCELDLYILKSVNDLNPDIGDVITFTIEIGNTSGLYATNIEVLEEIQSGFNFLSYSASQGSYNENTSIWSVGDLNPMSTAFLYIDVEVLGSGIYTNTVSIESVDQDDDEVDNNDDIVIITPASSGDIGDYIWHDADGNGVQNANETGIENIPVELYSTDNLIIPVDYLFTGPQGEFCFTGLDDGDYFIKVIVPDTFMTTLPLASVNNPSVNDNQDSDIDHSNGPNTSGIITILNGNSVKNCDAGLHLYGSIGNIVWLDDPQGLPSRYEPGIDQLIDGVTIQLYEGVDSIMMKETTTVNGSYLFDELAPGAYYLKIYNIPDSTILVQPFAAPPGLDNDFIPVSANIENIGFTQMIYLGVEEHNMSIDAGLEVQEGTVPIELFDFWGERIEDEEINRLFWITDLEVNTDYFIVERAIDQIHTFEEIGTVEAAGNSSERQYYTFDDLDAREPGTYYYRLWTVDLNGSESKSHTIAIEVEGSSIPQEISYKIYPIPTSNDFTIEIKSSIQQEFQGYLINNLGQNVRKLVKQSLPDGTNRISVNVADLAQGQYYLNFYLGEEQYIEKILVVH